MRRNALRIVCNPYTRKLAYYFKNQSGKWEVLSENSPLSRQSYTNVTISEGGSKIIEASIRIYNRRNRGLDILFEGSLRDYKLLQSIVASYRERKIDITCNLGSSKIAVVGKAKVGKTTLIKSLLGEANYKTIQRDNYTKFEDAERNATWFEIKGIDLEENSLDSCFSALTDIANDGLNAVIYCVLSSTGRVEDPEIQLLNKIEKSFDQTSILLVLTKCVKDDFSKTLDDIKRLVDPIKIVETLASPYKGRAGKIVTSFGLTEVERYIFEGR